MSNVERFPIEGTKLYGWYLEAANVAKQSNLITARLWCIRNVPEQFVELIVRSVRHNEMEQ